MKRYVLLTIFFYVCTFTIPPHARAIPPLAIIPAAQIGASIMALAAGSAITQIAFNNSENFDFNGTALTAPILAYNNVMMAGAQVALGYAAQASINIQDLYDRGVLQAKSALNDVINQFFPTSSSVPSTSDTFAVPCTSPKGKLVAPMPPIYPGCASGAWYKTPPVSPVIQCNGYITIIEKQNCGTLPDGSEFYRASTGIWTPSDDEITWPNPGPPLVLPSDKVGPLSQALSNAAQSNPAVNDSLKDVVKANPGAMTTPAAIPQTDINNWAQNKSNAAQEGLISALEALAAANPENAEIAAELAKAQAEQAKDQAEEVKETYSPLSPSGFAEPYNPGEFDIPARFTTFMDRIKSTGLFSFSSSFFNSLPGGGSPVYEIEGGQTFGHHTIDLSQTLSAGLAILKTILLACFGFLSIRAVILKR